jgi:hypothetical protein
MRSRRMFTLSGEEILDLPVDLEIALVDLVVERDDLVGQLDVLVLERIDGSPYRSEHEASLLVQARLQLVELAVELEPVCADAHPNRPVT